MLSGEGNADERWKTTIGLISKRATLHVQHTFIVHFFTVVLHDYNVKLPETSQLHVLWRKCLTFSCSLFFFTAAHFHLALVAASISHIVTAATKFSCCSSNKKMSLVFISCSRLLLPLFSLSFAGLPPTFSFSLSFSCSIFQICGHDTYSKLNTLENMDTKTYCRFPFSSSLTLQFSLLYKTRVAMRFPVKITLSCIWVATPVD